MCTGKSIRLQVKEERSMASDKKATRKTIGCFGSRERHQIESDVYFRNIGHFVQRRISVKISKDSGKIV